MQQFCHNDQITKKYKILEKIGSGAFSTVYHAITLTSPPVHVVLKVIKEHASPTRIENEVRILMKLK